MVAPDWKSRVTPTMDDVRAARARSPGDGMLAALMRTAMGAIGTLAEHGITMEVVRGSMNDGQYMGALWPYALAVTERESPGTQAHMAAELLGLICTLFDHWSVVGDTLKPQEVDFKGLELAFAIGSRTGMLTLGEAGLFDIADQALTAKAGRGKHAKRLNAGKTEWHDPSLSRAVELRAKYPHRSDAKLADVIMADAKVFPAPPSTQALLEAMAKWRGAGLLNQRRRVGDNLGSSSGT